MTGAVLPGTASADLCPKEQSHYWLHLDSSVAFPQPRWKGRTAQSSVNLSRSHPYR